jgi:hypothetical protein
LPSFLAGTRILTIRGRVKIENLRIGDVALTGQNIPMPIRWIGRKMYRQPFTHANSNIMPVLIKAGAIEQGRPARDLWISPFHSIHVDGILVPAHRLINGISILRCENMPEVSYFHLEFETVALILAENLFTESYVERGNRAMFLNADEAMEAERRNSLTRPWSSCGPMIEQGPALDRIRAHIALRAGILPQNIMERPQDGPLLGCTEWVDNTTVCGWVWLPHHPNTPVVIEIREGAEVIGCVVADLAREDLRKAGIGTGNHGFHLQFSRPLDPTRPHKLSVIRAADGSHVPGSPLTLRAQPTMERLRALNLTDIAATSSADQIRQILSWLQTQSTQLTAILDLAKPEQDNRWPGASAAGASGPTIAEIAMPSPGRRRPRELPLDTSRRAEGGRLVNCPSLG